MMADFRVVPIGTGSSSLSAQLAEVLGVVDGSGVSYKVNDMRTILEGDWDTVMGLIKKCHDKMMESSDRVTTIITIDDRGGRTVHIGDKVASIENALGKSLCK
ncbi:MAG: MTH1187 family thiamine-binding protein [Candidatus Brocadiales bacterium]